MFIASSGDAQHSVQFARSFATAPDLEDMLGLFAKPRKAPNDLLLVRPRWVKEFERIEPDFPKFKSVPNRVPNPNPLHYQESKQWLFQVFCQLLSSFFGVSRSETPPLPPAGWQLGGGKKIWINSAESAILPIWLLICGSFSFFLFSLLFLFFFLFFSSFSFLSSLRLIIEIA
jgi:hypothetical protein